MRSTLSPLLAAALIVVACSDPTALEQRGGVAVSFATQGATGGAPPALSRMRLLDDTLGIGTDTLILTSVEIVLREIELKAVETADCDTEPEPAGCEEVEVGPVLVDLPLTLGAEQQFSIDVPTGAYSRIDFEVHKVSSDAPEDAAFRQAHPDLVDKSIRVRGSFKGVAFTFETDLDVEQELTLVPALSVSERADLNVTIRVDVDTWFVAADGSLMDPATGNKGGDNESEIKQNIKNSLHAFEDDDGDGSGD